MSESWTGFYGPAYRLMLKYADGDALPDSAWDMAIEMHRANPVGEGHWEFLALGYLHLFDRGTLLCERSAARLAALVGLFTRDHHTANWRLMAQIVRCRIDGHFLIPRDLDRIRLRQADDGFFPDIPGDNSSQYHAFILYLIMRFADPANAEMRVHVVRALDWLTLCHQHHGDPSPLGRGRFQLFGYAAMAAIAAQAERWQLPVPDAWHADVRARLQGVLRGAISPCWDGPHRSHLLHGYNTLEDYPAFVSLLTHDLSPIREGLLNEGDEGALWWHPLDGFGSGLLADRHGALVSVLVPQPAPESSGLRTLLRQFFGRAPSSNFWPQRVRSVERLYGNNIGIEKKNGDLHLNWSIHDHGSPFSDVTLWSPLPMLLLAVSGSVEHARLEWQQRDNKIWSGVAVHSARVSETKMCLRLR